jgi:hypothetical protein
MRTSLLLLAVATATRLSAADSAAPQDPNGKEDSALKVKIFEQVSPKPIGTIPEGWKMEKLAGHTVKQQPVPLPNGDSTDISTTAYTLVPETGPGILVFRDPGFLPENGNSQKRTIGAILTEHAEAHGALEARLSSVISELKEALTQSPAQSKAPSEPAKTFTRRKTPLAPSTTPNVAPTPTP